jgi:hypothetical protein
MTRRHRSVGATLGVWLIAALVAAVLGMGVFHAVRLVQVARHLRADVRALRASGVGGAEAHLSVRTVRALRMDLESLDQQVRVLYGATAWLARPIANLAYWPALRAWGLVLEGGLGTAQDLTATAWWSALAVENAVEMRAAAAGSVTVTRTELLDVVLQALHKEAPRLEHARAELVRAKAGFDQLRHHTLFGTRQTQALADYLDVAGLGLDGVLMLPELVQPGKARTYLLLMQNSDEMRATGGFISSVAVIKLQGSDLVSLDYMNSYNVESYRNVHPAPPPPLRTLMEMGVLLFRDANWSPDYPASAEVLASLYYSDMGEAVDGVVALDTTFVRLVLAALGSIPVPQYDVTVTAENVMETVIGFWERPLDAPAITERAQQHQAWLQRRKDFGGALLQAGMSRMSSVSVRDVLRIGLATRQAIRSKHLLAWVLNNPTLQGDLRRMGLDGGLQEAKSDYLMVVDSNVGWNKADRYVKRSVDYRVTVMPDGLRANVCLTYANWATAPLTECVHRADLYDTYDELAQQCYWDYVRVLAPRGSTLRAVQGTDWPVDATFEGGKTSFGALVLVPVGQTRTICFEYDLPPEVLRAIQTSGRYDLRIQKQPGAGDTPVSVTVDLGGQGTLGRQSSPWKRSSNGVATLAGRLESDLGYTLFWKATRR